MSDASRFDAAHDFAAKWPAPPDWRRATLEGAGTGVNIRHGLAQILVSGRLEAARARFCPQALEIGLWQVAKGPDLFVRMARDRALLVSDNTQTVPESWQEEGWCATDLSDSRLVFEIRGPRIAELIRRGTSVDFLAGSPSAAILFAGVDALLYRTAEDCARLHVDQSFAPYSWRWLEEQVRGMAT